MNQVRCAIYTRKSSDEGLEQSFNSLDAQREACAAYILSQASEGWSALPDIYDDGGLSGGTLVRPALRRLLAEVAAGRVDIIVVYKVDRLTRSLFDFAKLVETFDTAGTSFVSVTQSFNTTTSMGRLTLNMLLSFAQFEREVTAERIRDKIAASKARGMWMGGTPPLGYAPDGRSLSVVEDHAAIVRDIFRRYLALGNVRLLADALSDDGVRVPRRTKASTGAAFGGVAFTRGQLYAILNRPAYVGEIHHRGSIHQALHPPIIDRAVWDRTQALLASNTAGTRQGSRAASPSLLAGKVVDPAGEPLLAAHATRGTIRYRYYISRALHTGSSAAGLRIPARELDLTVTARLMQLFADPLALIGSCCLDVRSGEIGALMTRCADVAVSPAAPHRASVRALVQQVRVHRDHVEIGCSTEAIAELLQVVRNDEAPSILTIRSEVTLARSGAALRLIQTNGATIAAAPNQALIRLILRARRWWGTLRTGEMDISTLAASEGLQNGYVTRVLRLAFLAPSVVDAILAGTLRAGMDVAALTALGAIAPLWTDQAATMLPTGGAA